MSVNSIIRGLKSSSAQDIEMNALNHRHYILFAIKEFFVSGFSLAGINEADHRREQEIKDELSNVMLNIVGRFKIDANIEFEQTTEIYTNKQENFTLNIEKNPSNEYYLVLHNHNNNHTETLIKIDDEFMNKCYKFVASPLFYKERLISEAIQAEKNFNSYQEHMKIQFEKIKLHNPDFTVGGDLTLFTNMNPSFLEYEEVYGYFLREFIIDLIEKENQQKELEMNALRA